MITLANLIKQTPLARMYQSGSLKQLTETLGTRLFVVGIGVVNSIILARALQPEGRGAYAIALTIGLMGVQFTNLGLHASNTYFVAKNKELLPKLITNTLWICFGCAAIVTLVGALLTQFWPKIIPVAPSLFWLAIAWIPLGLCIMLLQNLLLGIGRIRTFNQSELFLNILTLILLVTLGFFYTPSTFAAFALTLVAQIAGCVFLIFQLRTNVNYRSRPSLSLFQKNIAYGIRAYFAALFSFLVLKIDLLMIKYLLGTAAVGYYSIAVNLNEMAYLLPVVTGMLLFPKLAALDNEADKLTLTQTTVKTLSVAMIIILMLAWILARPAVLLVFGEAYLPALPAFYALLPATFFLSINTIYMNYLAAKGLPLIVLISSLTASVLNITLNLMTIPRWGITGAAYSSIASYGLMLTFSLLFIYAKRQKN